METKLCKGCGCTKHISKFHDGYKSCIKCKEKKERHRKSEKYRETRKEYRLAYQKKSIVNKLYEYKRGADSAKRNIYWYLSDEYATELFKGNCHYCGISSSECLNGIDRKDNNRGYVPDNCLSCCETCNFMKGELAYEQFIDMCRRVSKFQT